MRAHGSRNLTMYQKIFNYHPIRTKRIVENVFEILANRFQIFLSLILLRPENTERIIFASFALHNCLRTNSANHYKLQQSFYCEINAQEVFEE